VNALEPDVATLLRAHGVAGRETPFPNNGYSGARISAIDEAAARYLLKRMRVHDDWLMRLTRDVTCREAEFAASSLSSRLPATTAVATLGAAHDGDGWALLMRDVSTALLPDEGLLSIDELALVLHHTAALHARFWCDALDGAGVRWCAPSDRLRVLTPDVGQLLIDEGRDFGLARGWRVFEAIAPAPAVALVHELFADTAPLLRLLDALPATLLHGDLKLANVALDDGRLVLLDWALVSRAPVAIEISWFLAVNSGRLPCSLDDTLDLYERALRQALGAERFAEARWSLQRAAIALIGVLSYGWGKALDAEAGRPEELRWWCEGALAGARYL